jgi:hypothetical protein
LVDQRSSGSGEDTTKGRFSTLAGLRFFPSATKTSPLMNLHKEKVFFKINRIILPTVAVIKLRIVHAECRITQNFEEKKMNNLFKRSLAM